MPVRNIFHKKVPEPVMMLPRDWPSSLHSKCDSPACSFPNPPQAAEGTYNCQGFPCCSGTYHVSAAMAASVIRSYSFGWSREAVEKAASSSTPSLGRAPSIKSIKQKSSRRFNRSKQKDLPPIPGLHIRSGSLSPGPNSPSDDAYNPNDTNEVDK
ncbi:hypothetical protein D9619_004267 [Psilocybe cf. subviscida]|uniref:Uncharacterized protein n=1 Tax=Psilocybe cf. subviscida TaxID=2480587 RepID=A0A8H5BPQ4_9AGAR|nr:hypothetical protein D9619_004267 [Psilocybe cf. subviscida]